MNYVTTPGEELNSSARRFGLKAERSARSQMLNKTAWNLSAPINIFLESGRSLLCRNKALLDVSQTYSTVKTTRGNVAEKKDEIKYDLAFLSPQFAPLTLTLHTNIETNSTLSEQSPL